MSGLDVADPAFLAGYLSGLLEGIERGRSLADQEAAARHHQAWRVVQAAAKSPEQEELATRRRTLRAWGPPAPWPESAPIHPRALEVVLTPAERGWAGLAS